MGMSSKAQNICYGVVAAIGLILIIVSMAGFAYFPPLIQSQVFENLDLTDTESEGYKNFMAPPVPLYMSFNMYHVVNPEDIKNGSKPILEEIGPFVYREKREKRDPELSPDGCSITTAQYKSYHFDPEKTNELCPSCGDARTTNVTLINAAYVGILQFIREGFTKELADRCVLGMCLNDNLQQMIDRISCAVHHSKWSTSFAVFGDGYNYPDCERPLKPDPQWEVFKDDLFVTVSVDDFLFQGYHSGAIQIMQQELIGRWGLDDPTSDVYVDPFSPLALFNWTYPLIRKPYVLQWSNETNGVNETLSFAALNTKNDTINNEHYEIDTGKCGPRSEDNWWLRDPNEADNEMINYMQIKQWGPKAGRLNYSITPDVLCHDNETTCFDNPLEGGPYDDFGWWTQNNGYQCFNDSTHRRDFCYDSNDQMQNHNNICNWPRGTDGQQFHPYVDKDERLFIFQTDICRSLYMDYKEDVEFKGVKSYKFVVPKEALDVSTEYNLGFCKEVQRGVIEKTKFKDGSGGQEYHTVDWDACVEYESFQENPEDSKINIEACKNQTGYDRSHDCKAGILDISKCMEGAAVTISSPHFYQSDPALWQMFENMSNPDETPEKYETFMYVEPYTGAALSLHKRLQFNIPLHRDSHSAFMGDLWEEHSLFPMFWIEEFADLDDAYQETLNDMLIKPLKIIDGVQWTLFAVGVVMVIVAAILFAIKCCK